MSISLAASSLFSLFTLVVSPSDETPAPPSTCERSTEADNASLLYGEAQQLAADATIALEHAEVGSRYAQAVRMIPPAERPRKQGTKYAEKAHEAYLRAITDTGAALDQRLAWADADQRLLEEFQALAQQQRELEDPCLGDTQEIDTALALITVLRSELEGKADAHDQASPSEPKASWDSNTESASEDTSSPTPAAPPDPTSSQPASPPPSGRGLVIGGAVSLGIGGAGLVMMASGMATALVARSALPSSDPGERAPIFRRGEVGNALAISGGVIAGVGVGLGIALLVVGKQRQRRASSYALRPSLRISTGEASLSLQGRF